MKTSQMQIRSLYGSVSSRSLTVTLILLACSINLSAKNYIHYHQRSLVVQEDMAQGDTAKALALLAKLEKRYGLMPSETFARAMCQFTIGDTAAARRSYLKSLEQRAPLGWLFVDPPHFRSAEDSLCYDRIVGECAAFWKSRPEYVDGPNGTVPTPATWVNNLFQHMVDSLKAEYGGWNLDQHPDGLRRYQQVVKMHDLLLDSIITGKLPVPSIAKYGVNNEFAMLVIHANGDFTYDNRKHFKRWLKKGLIYPRVYCICFDRREIVEGKRLPYGYTDNLTPDQLIPGYEKRRAAIGMGDDRLDALRFHMGS